MSLNVKPITREIHEKFKSSFAEGKQNADSDYDFYIVVDDSQKDMLDLTTKAYRSIRHKRKRPVDIIVNTEGRFESKKTSPVSVEGEVAGKGVLLYEASKSGGIKIGMFKGEESASDRLLFALFTNRCSDSKQILRIYGLPQKDVYGIIKS